MTLAYLQHFAAMLISQFILQRWFEGIKKARLMGATQFAQRFSPPRPA
jgi:hypothetical protein